jgi:hypothetical protein
MELRGLMYGFLEEEEEENLRDVFYETIHKEILSAHAISCFEILVDKIRKIN